MTNDEFEPVRIRIMKEAYDLADRNDIEGYNSVKVMCGEVQTLLQREWVGLTDEERDAITDKVIGFNSCCGWENDYARAIEAKLKERNK